MQSRFHYRETLIYVALISCSIFLWGEMGMVTGLVTLLFLMFLRSGFGLSWLETGLSLCTLAGALGYVLYEKGYGCFFQEQYIIYFGLETLFKYPIPTLYYIPKGVWAQSLSIAAMLSFLVGIIPHNKRKLVSSFKKEVPPKSSVSTGSIHLGSEGITQQPVSLSRKDMNLHTLILGTTGSGKTNTICNIMEHAITQGDMLIYVDGKGDLELAKNVQHYTELHNHSFYLFNMIGCSCHYNPLKTGGSTSKKDRIIELRTWTEDYYRKLAEGYMQTVFNVLEAAKVPIDLSTLAQYMTQKSLFMLAREYTLSSHLIDAIEQLDKAEKHIGSLQSELSTFIQSDIGHLFETSGGNKQVLELERALEEKAVIYFCLQPLAFPAYSQTLGKLIINDIKALAASQLSKQHKQPIYCIFDEFSVFAGDQVINLINQGRSAGIHAVLSTQTLSDLTAAKDEAFTHQIVSNCNNYITHRLNSAEDADQMANIISTREAAAYTLRFGEETQQQGAGSIRHTREYIIHPDDIKKLTLGEAILVTKRNFAVKHLQVTPSAILQGEMS